MCLCIGCMQIHGSTSSSTLLKIIDPSYDFHDFCFLLMMCVKMACYWFFWCPSFFAIYFCIKFALVWLIACLCLTWFCVKKSWMIVLCCCVAVFCCVDLLIKKIYAFFLFCDVVVCITYLLIVIFCVCVHQCCEGWWRSCLAMLWICVLPETILCLCNTLWHVMVFYVRFVLHFACNCVLDCTLGHEFAHGLGKHSLACNVFLLKLCVTFCM